MADIDLLTKAMLVGTAKGLIGDTWDPGFDPDWFNIWVDVTLQPRLIGPAENAFVIRITNPDHPMTIALTPIAARFESGVLRAVRNNPPANDTPTADERELQEETPGVPLLAETPELELPAGVHIVYDVTPGTFTINGVRYTLPPFTFAAPTTDTTIDYSRVDRIDQPPLKPSPVLRMIPDDILIDADGDVRFFSNGIQLGETQHLPSAVWTDILGKPAVVAAGATAADARAAINVSSTAEMSAAITAAVNGLLAGAPGALDTLKELADALGDDANFAATVTAAIAAKYTKPVSGIPKADLVAAVQASLGLADTAYQAPAVVAAGATAAAARNVIDTVALHPVAYIDPSTRADGAITGGDALDAGRWFSNTGSRKLKIVGGRIVHDPASASGANTAGYGQIDTRGTSTPGAPSNAAADLVRVMRAEIAWPANALGSAAFVCPSALATWDWDAGSLPAAGFHMGIYGNGIWVLGVWNPGSGGVAYGQIHDSVQPGTATAFTLTVQTTTPAATNTTAVITAGATAAQLTAAIEALTNVGAGKVTVTKSPSGNYGITWASSLGTVTLSATVTGTGTMGMAAPLPTNSANTIAPVVHYATGVTTYADNTTVKRPATVWDNVLRPMEVDLYPELDKCVIIFPDGTNSGPIYHPGIGLWTSSRAVFELFENNTSAVDVPASYGKISVNNAIIPADSPLVDRATVIALAKAMIINGWDSATQSAANGTTVLTADSPIIQQITTNGSNGQTYQLPAAVPTGTKLFYFTNNSNGVLTINASNGSIVTALATGNTAIVFTLATAPTTPGSWLPIPIVTLSGVQSVTSKTFTLSNWVKSINTQTGTAYTLVLTDRSKIVTMNNAAASTLTIPLNAAAAFSLGEDIEVIQLGAGQVTINATAGVTLLATPGLKIAGQGGRVRLVKTGTDTWVVSGSLSA